MENGKFSVVLASPEMLGHGGSWNKLMKNKKYQKHTCLIAIDEAHVIVLW